MSMPGIQQSEVLQYLLDQVKLRFAALEDLERGDLAGFLREHLEAVRNANQLP